MSKNESRESSILVRKLLLLFTTVSHPDRRERPEKVPKTKYKTPLSFGQDDTIKLVTVTKESMTVKITEAAYIVQEFR